MYKWLFSLLLAVACFMGVYLMATGLPEKPHDESAELAEGQELLKISATNFEFDEKEYHVTAGTTYIVKYSNKIGNHGMEVEGLELNLDKENSEAEFVFDTPGTYVLKCSIMCGAGHADMHSTIVVS